MDPDVKEERQLFPGFKSCGVFLCLREQLTELACSLLRKYPNSYKPVKDAGKF